MYIRVSLTKEEWHDVQRGLNDSLELTQDQLQSEEDEEIREGIEDFRDKLEKIGGKIFQQMFQM